MTEGDADADSNTETECVWLVERDYTDKGMVTIVYASTDGERHLQRQLSERMVVRADVTAGKHVETGRLSPTPDGDRGRYAAEASRMAEQHEPDNAV
jgi:hypothetical protein